MLSTFRQQLVSLKKTHCFQLRKTLGAEVPRSQLTKSDFLFNECRV